MNKPIYPVQEALCGAKGRNGKPCRNHLVTGRTRCRMHGGKSLAGAEHGRYRTGMYTKEALAIRRESRQLVQRARAMLAEI